MADVTIESNGNAQKELVQLAQAIVLNPVVGYVGGMMIIEYLRTHTSRPYGSAYLPNELALGMQATLSGAMVANALGGISKLISD